jgi:adenylate cyclase
MQKTIKHINKNRIKRKEESVHIGIGINKGTAVSGNIGSRDRMDYTIIGDAVNLGARLCSAAGPDEILISKTVYSAVKDKISCKELKPINVKGKKERIAVYRVL